MTTSPSPVRVLLRGLLWGLLLGGTVGAGVWIAICLSLLALPGVVLTPLAFGVGAAVGVLPGLVGAAAVAAAARTRPVTPDLGGMLAAAAGAGLAFDLALVLLWSDLGPGVVVTTFVVATVLLGGTGAVGGRLVARPAPARPRRLAGAHDHLVLAAPTSAVAPVSAPVRGCGVGVLGGPRRH